MRVNSLTLKATDLDVEKNVKGWLKFAAERDGGRKICARGEEEPRRLHEIDFVV